MSREVPRVEVVQEAVVAKANIEGESDQMIEGPTVQEPPRLFTDETAVRETILMETLQTHEETALNVPFKEERSDIREIKVGETETQGISIPNVNILDTNIDVQVSSQIPKEVSNSIERVCEQEDEIESDSDVPIAALRKRKATKLGESNRSSTTQC